MSGWVLALACSRVSPLTFGPAQELTRASIAVRGVRPSLEDLREVERDRDALRPLIDGYLEDPAFGATVRDQQDEAWGIWSDYAPVPANGSLVNLDMVQIKRALYEMPLRLVERVVLEDRPYGEVYTADWAMADAVAAAAWVGIDDYPQGSVGWEEVHWSDGRPHAGILSDSMLWVVYRSAGSNFHRGRAAVALRAAVCVDLFADEVPIDSGDVNFADPVEVGEAVSTDPACLGCHGVLDPVAAAFPFRDYFVLQRSTWPIPMMAAGGETAWQTTLGTPPAYFGEPIDGLAGLGAAIAADPRMAECTTRRWEAYLRRLPLSEVQVDPALVQTFDERQSVKDVVRALVGSERFLASPSDDGEWLKIRPRAWSAMIEDLTGFRWEQRYEALCCDAELGEAPLGTVDLLQDAHIGYRVLAGGVDAPFQSTPVPGPNPTFALTARAVAWRAAAHAVERAAAGDATGLLVPGELQDPPSRGRLEDLALRALGLTGREAREEVDELAALYDEVEATEGAEVAWTALVAALLQHPRALLY